MSSWAAMNENKDSAVAVGGVAGEGEWMPVRTMQMKECQGERAGHGGVDGGAVVVLQEEAGWMAGSCALSTASVDPSGGRAARCVYQNSPVMVRPAEVDSTMLTGVLASTS